MIRSALSCLLVSALPLGADPAGAINTEEAPGEPMPAAEAAASLVLPAGFEATVFAAEPAVQNPIACTWDSRGRLWIAENYTYERRAGVTLPDTLGDRIVILADGNGDGRHDTRAVFTGGLRDLTSIEWAPEGLYVLCPPQLLFFPDANQDGAPDGTAQILLDGFTIPKRSSHNFANGLRWGPDGWLYGRCGASAPGDIGVPGTRAEERVPIRGGIWRYHPGKRIYETLCHGTTNPWGHDWNAEGELFFINTVNGHFFHLIEGAHYTRGVSRDPNPHVYQLIDHHADHWHFDTAQAWHQSRGGVANDFGGGHAHVGMTIYQGDNFPEEYHGNVFTLNLHGRRCNRETLHRHGSGYQARHAPEFFVSKDPFFRGIDITTGPDGAMYVLDWSDTGECHENTGVHRTSGRIFRIAFGKPARTTPPKFDQAGEEELRALGEHPNVWHRRMAALLLRQTNTKEFVHAPLDRVDSTRSAKAGPGPATNVPLDTPPQRLKAASLLQRLPHDERPALARPLLAHPEDAEDHNLPLMIWYGLIPLAEEHAGDLAALVPGCRIPLVRRLISRRLAEDLATNPGGFQSLVQLTAGASDEVKEDVLAGAFAGTRAAYRLEAPEGWPTFRASLERSGKEPVQSQLRALELLFGDGQALDRLVMLARDGKAPVETRKAALRSLIQARAPGLKKLCLGLLGTPSVNGVAVEGLTHFPDREVAERAARAFPKFHPRDHGPFITNLVSRAEFAHVLLDHLQRGRIPKDLVTPFHARQIQHLGDEALTARLAKVWGVVRETPANKRARIASLRNQLDPQKLATADLPAGRTLYTNHCRSCHKLHGEGGSVGPDLTGSGRHNLDYLLHNLVDPSAEVSADYRVTVLTLRDDRTLTGRIQSESKNELVFVTQDSIHTLPPGQVSKRHTLPQSLMPEGLLEVLSPEQQRDLIAFLMHPGRLEQ